MKVTVENVWKRKKIETETGEIKDLTILSDVSVEFCGSCVEMVLGPSGSGKTTLLRLLNKLESPSQGTIYIDDKSIESISPKQVRNEVGMVFQSPALFRGNIFDNVRYGPRLKKRSMSENEVRKILKLVGLNNIDLQRDVENLSQGQQQRVSFARALANQPKVLLLDEPTSALDPSAANNLLDLIRKINLETGLSIIMVTHVMEHAQRIADNISLLVDGRIVESGSAEFFFKKPQTETGLKFIQGQL